MIRNTVLVLATVATRTRNCACICIAFGSAASVLIRGWALRFIRGNPSSDFQKNIF